LTEVERGFVASLLAKFLPDETYFQEQLVNSVVTRICGCGCPTFDLWENGSAAPPASEARVFWQGFGETVRGDSVGILLFQTAGRLSCCEVFYNADESRADLPVLEGIKESPTSPSQP
jgi:hypothetical protein